MGIEETVREKLNWPILMANGLALTAALAWNDAIQKIVGVIVSPKDVKSPKAVIMSALVITVLILLFVSFVTRVTPVVNNTIRRIRDNFYLNKITNNKSV